MDRKLLLYIITPIYFYCTYNTTRPRTMVTETMGTALHTLSRNIAPNRRTHLHIPISTHVCKGAARIVTAVKDPYNYKHLVSFLVDH